LKVVRTPQGKEIPLYKGSYALIVGNSDYTSGWDPLVAPEKDVEELATILRKNGFEVFVLKNITKSRFLNALGNFTYKYGQDRDNQLLFFYAGHGHTTTLASREELGYLVMVDAPLPEGDPQGFDDKSVDMQTIITYAKKIRSKHVLFIFDSCFSGTVLNLRQRIVPKAISDAVRYPVRQFITAGRADEPVPDRSVFKQLFVDILEGKIEEPIKDGYITGEELGLYLKNKVPEYNKFQHPQYGKIRDPNLDKGNFVFVLESNKATISVGEKPIFPKKTEKMDLSYIEEPARQREEVLKSWDDWQNKMNLDFQKVEDIDKSSVSSQQEKKAAWELFLKHYDEDNPYSSEDEALRKKAKVRLNFWDVYKLFEGKDYSKEAKPVSKESKEGEILSISEVDVLPRLVKTSRPKFSRRLLTSLVVKVPLRILIKENGNVDDVQIVGDFLLHKDVKAAVIKAVKKWKFEPAWKDRKKVKVWKKMTITLEGR